MDINNSSRFYHTFIIIFIILFVILVIMPFVVEQAMHFLNNGIIQRDNSIIVFKDLINENETISKFFEALNKIRNFM